MELVKLQDGFRSLDPKQEYCFLLFGDTLYIAPVQTHDGLRDLIERESMGDLPTWVICSHQTAAGRCSSTGCVKSWRDTNALIPDTRETYRPEIEHCLQQLA